MYACVWGIIILIIIQKRRDPGCPMYFTISSTYRIVKKSSVSGIIEIMLTLMLLVANMAYTKWRKTPEKWLKTWYTGTHLRVLSKSFPMNTNMIGFRWFPSLCILVLLIKEAVALEGLRFLCTYTVIKIYTYIGRVKIPTYGRIVEGIFLSPSESLRVWEHTGRSPAGIRTFLLRDTSPYVWLSVAGTWPLDTWPHSLSLDH